MLTTQEIYNEIIQSLASKTPFSIVRCGDGEAAILNGLRDRLPANKRIRNHFGYELSEQDFQTFHQLLSQAFSRADIIGVPYGNYLTSRNRFWYDGVNILKETTYLQPNHKFCSMNIHLDFLTEGWFDKILGFAKQVLLITPHILFDFLIQKHTNLTSVNQITIPYEHTYFSDRNQVLVEKHFPNRFQGVQSELTKNNLKGVLALVGAGPVGKIYCKLVKDQGGVAVDIGSVFDRWAGFKTRSTKSKTIIDNTYKL